jgi:hypothetical protein
MKLSALTYWDRAIIAHDFLNPDIPDNYRQVPVAMMFDDEKDARIMASLTGVKSVWGSVAHATRAFIGIDRDAPGMPAVFL